jgi:hypothetical protein
MASGGRRGGKWSLPVLIPISTLLLLAFAVSPYNSPDLGSYDEAWPNLAGVWMLMASLLAALWILGVKAGPILTESRIPALIVLASSVSVVLLGLTGLSLASHVTGFPGAYQQMMLWFSVSLGVFLGGLGILLRDSLRSSLLGSFAYVASTIVGVVTIAAAIVMSALLLTVLPSAGIS